MKNKGFTIIELIISIAILSFGIIGAYSFFYPASRAASQSPQRIMAIQLAQEGVEITKNLRDNSILIPGNSFAWTLCSSGCQLDYKTGTLAETSADQLAPYADTFLKQTSDGFYGYDDGAPTLFKRKVTISQFGNGGNLLKVDVVVLWGNAGTSLSFETIDYIYNYHSL